jgi:succinyl-diaminopimelate desuccinylase
MPRLCVLLPTRCSVVKQYLMESVDRDREAILNFIQDFVRCQSPNPPGDTRTAAKHITDFLSRNGHEYVEIAGVPEMPNIVARRRFARPGKQLVLNGHIDVFPVESTTGWTQPPWSGARFNGKIFGRGVSDMKVGTTASIFAYHYLSQVAEHLGGEVKLVAVSDEETFGPWGARYLFEHHIDEVTGDCVLIGEPTSRHTVRFGEKGTLWIRFTVSTKGAHGAYTHASENAIILASRMIEQLLTVQDLEPQETGNLAASLDAAAPALDAAYGNGASKIARRVTANVGLMTAGVKINMVASKATFEVDFRIPLGLDAGAIEARVEDVLKQFPTASAERITLNPPSWSAPDHEMVDLVKVNAAALYGEPPVPVIGIAATDARLWRYHDIPAVVFGPAPHGMASDDEHTFEDEAIKVVKTHLACAWDFLKLAT